MKNSDLSGWIQRYFQENFAGKLGSFEEAAKENVRRKERAEDLFAATVEREKNKSSILDKTFKEALERAKADPSKPKGIFDDE